MSSAQRRTVLVAVAAIAAAVSTGCATDTGTAATTTTAQAQHNTAAGSPAPTGQQTGGYSGDGAFSIGSTPADGTKGAIPPGRYTAELMSGSTAGYWVRCSMLPCSMTSTNNILDLGKVPGPGSSVVEVLPTDGAVYLQGLVFRPAR